MTNQQTIKPTNRRTDQPTNQQRTDLRVLKNPLPIIFIELSPFINRIYPNAMYIQSSRQFLAGKLFSTISYYCNQLKQNNSFPGAFLRMQNDEVHLETNRLIIIINIFKQFQSFFFNCGSKPPNRFPHSVSP